MLIQGYHVAPFSSQLSALSPQPSALLARMTGTSHMNIPCLFLFSVFVEAVEGVVMKAGMANLSRGRAA